MRTFSRNIAIVSSRLNGDDRGAWEQVCGGSGAKNGFTIAIDLRVDQALDFDRSPGASAVDEPLPDAIKGH